MNIKTVTVIGANGTMGCNISGIFASFGNCKVYMIGRNKIDVEKSVKKAVMSVKGDAILNKLFPKDYSELEKCIKESDLIFESTAENLQVKKEINEIIAKNVEPGQIICTGTSGLSINVLSDCFEDDIKKYYLGIHFFNPPYNMTLCEIIPAKYTNCNVVKEIREYMEETLIRTTVEVKDTPAFLGNRIGFQFINEAIEYAERYKDNGGIDYIDAILGQFTGRSMPPIATADFVGLDVHKAIVDNIYENTSDYAKETFILPQYVENLIERGNLGRKTGKGLYYNVKGKNGERKRYVYDILTGQYRESYAYSFPFAENMITELQNGNYRAAIEKLINNKSLEAEICVDFLLKYVIYALVATNEVGESITDADDVMATGFNWIPPLAVIDALGGKDQFVNLCKNHFEKNFLHKTNLEKIVKGVRSSEYDYRKYLKARY